MGDKGSEWEQLIPTHSPEVPLSPNVPLNRPVSGYPVYPNTESLILDPEKGFGKQRHTCVGNILCQDSTNFSDALTFSHKNNPQINLSFPTPQLTPERSAANAVPAQETESDCGSGTSPRASLPNAGEPVIPEDYFGLENNPHNRDHTKDSSVEQEEQVDDTKSQSHLSASPDFWRRVSPQLVYIDSVSYASGRSSSSVNSRSRERSNERYAVRDRRRSGAERRAEFESCSVDSVASVTEEPEGEWRAAEDSLVASRDGNTEASKSEQRDDGVVRCRSDDQINVVGECQEEEEEDDEGGLSDGCFSKLTRRWSRVRDTPSMKYKKRTTKIKSDFADLAENDHDKACEANCVDKQSSDAKTGHRETSGNPVLILSSKSDSCAGEPDSTPPCDQTGYDSGVCRALVHHGRLGTSSGPGRGGRRQLRRYFSLDSSPVPNSVHRHLKIPSRSPLRRQRQLQCHPEGEQPQDKSQATSRETRGHGRPQPHHHHRRSNNYNQYYMEKDLRYYFQHPWFRLVVAYLVIFCNFLLFAEDPLSHSHTESNINMVGNVFSFVATKYPSEWYWKLMKVVMWVLAVLCGMLVGKVLIHGLFCKRMFRLKMFRDEQGSWMCMFLTVIVSMYMFSYVYNLLLLIAHPQHMRWQITSAMGVTNESMMKAAATCTWLGDLVTALMVTDMMLQDRLYPHWGTRFRRLYNLSNVPRILIFWVGSLVVSVVVIFLIVSDYISWNSLNKGFVETTELSRAFLASFILVMDLLIVMQDWDFPHFTSTIDVNLPGFSTHTLHWKLARLSFTGKWFNYGIIFMVMILDLNMWKNQIFYRPEDYGQYIDPVSRKVYMIEDPVVASSGNQSLWTWEYRSQVHPETGRMLRDDDPFMYSRWMGYSTAVKCTAFIPNVLGMAMFFTLITLYGRFPPNQDGTYGGRLKKRQRSSWRRERHSICEPYCGDGHDPQCRGSPSCVDYPCVRTRYMGRCSSSQPDFNEVRYSDPGDSWQQRIAEEDLPEEDLHLPSDQQYTITQHSDPGILDGRPGKHQKSFEYRDIRVFEDTYNAKNPKTPNEQELQQQFTEILAKNDQKFSHCENWSERADHLTKCNTESELSSIQIDNYRERIAKVWRQSYANKFKWNFVKSFRKTTQESVVNTRGNENEKVSQDCFNRDQIPTERKISSQTYEELCDSTARPELKTVLHASPRHKRKGHKRLSSNSSTETNSIEPVRVRIDSIRFFRRKTRKKNDAAFSAASGVPTGNKGVAAGLAEGATEDASGTGHDRPSEEFPEVLARVQSREGVPNLEEEEEEEEGLIGFLEINPEETSDARQSEPIHSINFGSNASINL